MDKEQESDSVDHGYSQPRAASLLSSDTKRTEVPDTDAVVLHDGRADAIDPEMERRIVRKFDTHIVPLVMGLYLLSFLDRSNIGNAEIAGMQQDLNLSSSQYEWLLTIFYISYILAEVLVIMWKLVPPHIWASFVVLGWGIIASCQGAAQNWQGMMALRFLLGIFEAGFGPGIPYLLSFFYLRHELGFRCGLFLSAAPLASTFVSSSDPDAQDVWINRLTLFRLSLFSERELSQHADPTDKGALAYGITSGRPSFPSWRILFLVEGLPDLLVVPIAFYLLPDTPDQARFLTDDEKRVAKARGVRQAGTVKRVGGLDFKDVGQTLLDPIAWLTALMYFSVNVSFSSLPVFLPTILEEMGFTAINAQGLSAPPYFLSFLVTFGSTWIADRTRQRGLMIMFLTIIGGVGYIILAATTSVGARYFAVYLVACGVFPAIANILPWTMNNQGSDTRRGIAMVMLQMVGQCGPLLGTRLYPSNEAPRYIKGQCVCAAFLFFTAALVLTLRTLLVIKNRRMEREFGQSSASESIGQRQDTEIEATDEKEQDLGGKAVAVENFGPQFRYML